MSGLGALLRVMEFSKGDPPQESRGEDPFEVVAGCHEFDARCDAQRDAAWVQIDEEMCNGRE